MLVSHDVQYHLVGFIHTFRTDTGQIPDAQVYIIFDDTFYGCHTFVLYGQDSRKYAVETPLVSFRAQLGFAPSQMIPVRLAIMFLTAKATCS